MAKVQEVEYPLTEEYFDDSKNILQQLGIEEDEDDDEDVEFQVETVDNDEDDDEDVETVDNEDIQYLKLGNDVLSLIELVKRTLSDSSVLDAFYYPRFFRYKKS